MAEDTTTEKDGEMLAEGLASEDVGVSRVYELGYHIVSTLPEETVAQKEAELKEMVTRHQGEVIASEEPKRVALAYTIRRKHGSRYEGFAEAYFGWMKFEMEGGEADALNRELLASEDVLRHLLFKTVREDTRAGIRGAGVTTVRTPSSGKRLVTEETAGQASEEDINRTVDELVAETEESTEDKEKQAEESTTNA